MKKRRIEFRKAGVRSTIPVKIVLIFTALLVPIYALLLISAGAYLNSIEEQALQNTQSILDINMAELESEISRIDSFYYNLLENDTAFQRLKRWTGSDDDKLALFSVNQTLRLQNPIISVPSSFYLYLEAADRLLFHDNTHAPAEVIGLRQKIERTWFVSRNINWEVGMVDGQPFLFHTIGDDGLYVGAMIDLNQIMARIQRDIPYEHVTVQLAEKNDPVKAPFIISEVHRTKHFIRVDLDRREIRESMPVVSRIVLAVGFVLVIVLPVLLILVFMQMIVRPIRRIEEGMFHLGSGEQDYRIPEFKASREFVGMRNSFNNMASEIETLKIQQYEEALEREQMMLQNLLLQIRPHFLLNFFNQIFSMAELEDYDGIKKSSLYLSRFFRHLFRSDRVATYRSELELVDAYLELMEERFTDCFTVTKDYDEKVMEYRVPPLIVQNFVENIFKYAVSDGNLIDIRLSLRKENGYVVMTIQDDGPGMDEEMLQKIREVKPIEKADGTHIGIYNSQYRLKKLCGEDCRIEVDSVLTEGTTVRILLPE